VAAGVAQVGAAAPPAAGVPVTLVPAIPAMEEPVRKVATVGWRLAQLARSFRPIRLGGAPPLAAPRNAI
jgi:hypothetical protein